MHEPPESADCAVVVVHGIGQQLRGETLLEWAEPIAARISHQCEKRGGETAQVAFAAITSEEKARIDVSWRDAGRSPRSVAFVEARWAESFLAFTPRTFILWAVSFVVTVARRVAVHLFRILRESFSWNPVVLPVPVRDRFPRIPPGARVLGMDPRGMLKSLRGMTAVLVAGVMLFVWLARAIGAVVSLVLWLIGGILYVLVLVPVPVLAGIGLILLGLLARLPLIGKRVQPLLVAFTSTLGDAAVWTRSPIRADAMRDTVRAQVRYAQSIAPRVIVIAHSQGAAVAARALFRDDFAQPSSDGGSRIDALVTIGGANTLLREPTWNGRRPVENDIVRTWAELKVPVRWINIWASMDPVPAGPVGASDEAVAQRWEELVRAPGEAFAELARREPGLLLYTSQRMAQLAGASYIPQQAIFERAEPGSITPYIEAWNFDPTSDVTRPQWRRRRREVNAALVDSMQSVGRGPGPLGPEEHIVENRLSVISDHTTYTRNIVEVITPLAELVQDSAAGRVRPMIPMVRPRQVAHRNGLGALILGRISLAILSFLLAPRVAGVLDEWLPIDWLSTGQLAEWTGDVAAAIEAIRGLGWWGTALYILVVSATFLVLSSIATACWRLYDRSLSRDALTSNALAGWGLLHYGLVFAATAAAVVVPLWSWLSSRLDHGDAIVTSTVTGVYTAFFAILMTRSRRMFLPLPERRSAEGSPAE